MKADLICFCYCFLLAIKNKQIYIIIIASCSDQTPCPQSDCWGASVLFGPCLAKDSGFEWSIYAIQRKVCSRPWFTWPHYGHPPETSRTEPPPFLAYRPAVVFGSWNTWTMLCYSHFADTPEFWVLLWYIWLCPFFFVNGRQSSKTLICISATK